MLLYRRSKRISRLYFNSISYFFHDRFAFCKTCKVFPQPPSPNPTHQKPTSSTSAKWLSQNTIRAKISLPVASVSVPDDEGEVGNGDRPKPGEEKHVSLQTFSSDMSCCIFCSFSDFSTEKIRLQNSLAMRTSEGMGWVCCVHTSNVLNS